MASSDPFHFLFLVVIASHVLSFSFVIGSSLMYPFNCSSQIKTCNSSLYHISQGFSLQQIASFYSLNESDIRPITHGLKQDYLVSVTCTCKDVSGTTGYFYDTSYRIQPGDTFFDVSATLYSGQAWQVPGVEELFIAGDSISMHLLCGCMVGESEEIVTYTAQENDTLSGISELLSAKMSGIRDLNKKLTENPGFIDVGWVLFVPEEKNGLPAKKHEKRKHMAIILAALSSVALFAVTTLVLILRRRKQKMESKEENPKAAKKCLKSMKASLDSQFKKRDIEDVTLETERPLVFSLEEICDATCNFDESRKIGEGGYGSVYVGTLKEKKVAIKKMKSSRSKEFFAELRVLCKIHHINVVELLGYASGDDHLYLVYEYICNGSLNEHLHDPLLKGHSPLSWTARAHIALDAARGIEYIHDHMKARYVHRDIKSINILLDQELRAKVADFGLARLIERTKEEDFVATRLVGTPGYLAPESVRELQNTSKTDVFAFGVVLAELITGQRALVRDNCEPKKMRSLVSLMFMILRDQDPVAALEANTDANLGGSYPMEEVCKMAEVSARCLSEDPLKRPQMQEIVQTLSNILMSSIEWEASPGGSNSQIFTGLFVGR